MGRFWKRWETWIWICEVGALGFVRGFLPTIMLKEKKFFTLLDFGFLREGLGSDFPWLSCLVMISFFHPMLLYFLFFLVTPTSPLIWDPHLLSLCVSRLCDWLCRPDVFYLCQVLPASMVHLVCVLPVLCASSSFLLVSSVFLVNMIPASPFA